MRDEWEVQRSVDWVDNAFGEMEREIRSWRPLFWIKTALSHTPWRGAFRVG